MNMTTIKKRFLLFPLVIASFLFTGCFDAIFQSIRDEIILEDGYINGAITSMVRYTDEVGEWLYVQNGCLYRKLISWGEGSALNVNNSHGKWSEVSVPGGGLAYKYYKQEFKGSYVCRVASDSDYIYILTCQPRYDEDSSRNIVDNFRVYYKSSDSGWLSCDKVNNLMKSYISILDEDNYMMDASIQLMCTNSPKKDHRKAYIRIGGDFPYETDTSCHQHYSSAGLVDSTHCSMFLLSGSDATPVAEGSGTIDSLKDFFTMSEYGEKGGGRVSDFGAGAFSCSCTWFDGGTVFYNLFACTTNETKDTDPDYFYFGDGDHLRYYSKDKNNLSNNITAIKDITKEEQQDGMREYQYEEMTYKDAIFNKLNTDGSQVYTYMTTIRQVEDASDKSTINVIISTVGGSTQSSGNIITKTMTKEEAVAQNFTRYIDELVAIAGTLLSSGGSTSDRILSICVSKDRMYIGTDESGCYKASISNGVPSRITDDNDSTKYSSQMCDPYVIPMLLCVDPSLSGSDTNNSFYSSMFFYYTENNAAASYRDVGLWAYYPGSDGWNKE